LADAGGGDGFVKDADGVNLVAKIFEGTEDSADVFGKIKVAGVDGGEHFLGEVGADTNAARGEAIDLKFCKMGDGGLLADSADDEAGIDKPDEAGQVIILRRVLADDGVFDP
jgi:hypothetical protein